MDILERVSYDHGWNFEYVIHCIQHIGSDIEFQAADLQKVLNSRPDF